MSLQDVSGPTIGRLPRYLASLMELISVGEPTISSDRLSELVDLNAATVRRDLASLGISGTRGVGYDIKHLVFEINQALGLNHVWPVIVVGAGNLGRALANYDGLADRGFPVCGLVDVDPALIGKAVGAVTVRPVDDVSEMVDSLGAAVGVLTTSSEGAQEAADALVAAGVRSILNLTPQAIVVPEEVDVRRVDLATELQILSFYHQRRASAASGSGVPLSEVAS